VNDSVTTDLLGKRVGHVRIVGLLGSGAMGSVYVGFDEKLGRRVALKAIASKHRLDPGVRSRFQREARALSQLDHPNICRIHGYIEDSDSDFLVLELIDGKDLRAVIRERKTTFDQRLALAEQIASALASAHERGIVHRDIKPANVMVAQTGGAKVLDFGLARTAVDENAPTLAAGDADSQADHDAGAADSSHLRTRLGTVLGTLAYMSPEQARGEPASTASDMYSYGLLFQELMTGDPAIGLDSPPDELLEAAKAGLSRRVTGLDVATTQLIERLKAQSPAVRPSALDTVERIRWIRASPARGRLRLATVSVIAALMALSLALGLTAWKATLEARRANREAKFNTESWLRHIQKLAEVEALQLRYALLTADTPLATQFLDSLTVDDRLRGGCVYDKVGRVLAQNRSGGSASCPSVSELGSDGHRVVSDELQVWTPVNTGKGERIGVVMLAADADYTARLR
jgi:serine/threonine protein kinase